MQMKIESYRKILFPLKKNIVDNITQKMHALYKRICYIHYIHFVQP